MTGTRIAIFGHLPPLPIVIDEPYHYDEIAFGLLFLFTIDLDIYMSLSLCFHRHPSVDGGKKRGEITSSFILFVVYSWKFATTEQCRTAADGEKGVTQLLAASRWYTYIYILIEIAFCRVPWLVKRVVRDISKQTNASDIEMPRDLRWLDTRWRSFFSFLLVSPQQTKKKFRRRLASQINECSPPTFYTARIRI